MNDSGKGDRKLRLLSQEPKKLKNQAGRRELGGVQGRVAFLRG